VKLSAREKRGLALFNDPSKGNCAACHPSTGVDGTPPLFTDFTYDNLGVPKNPRNGFYRMAPQYNPAGAAWVDHGLGGVLGLASEDGKFKVPTLRNIALTAPYMHNGYFTDLRSVVNFYNTRDVAPWPAPEVADTVNHEELGNLGLNEQEVEDLVAFLYTLSDGYHAPSDDAL
jgi:cytochrome c peroxidase